LFGGRGFALELSVPTGRLVTGGPAAASGWGLGAMGGASGRIHRPEAVTEMQKVVAGRPCREREGAVHACDGSDLGSAGVLLRHGICVG